MRGRQGIDDRAAEAGVHCVSSHLCIHVEYQSGVKHTARSAEALRSTECRLYDWEEAQSVWATDN